MDEIDVEGLIEPVTGLWLRCCGAFCEEAGCCPFGEEEEE